MSIGHLYVLLGEASIQVLCPFSDWIVWFLGVELYTLFIGEYVIPFSELCFHFVDGFLCCAKAF